MEKTALIIHGYPQEISSDHPVYLFFKERGYKIFAPKMFSSDLDFGLENALKIISDCLGICLDRSEIHAKESVLQVFFQPHEDAFFPSRTVGHQDDALQHLHQDIQHIQPMREG
jgi:hypothetical protein